MDFFTFLCVALLFWLFPIPPLFFQITAAAGRYCFSKLAQWYFAAVLFELFRHFKIEDLLFNPTAFAACPTVSNNCPVSIHLIPLNISFSKSL